MFDPENEGCYVKKGDPICTLADVHKLRGKAFVGQYDIDLISEGDEVTVLLSQSDTVMTGQVAEVSLAETDDIPRAIAASGELPVRHSDSFANAVDATYAVVLRLDDAPAYLCPGSLGIVRIETQPKTLASRILRLFDQVFRFEL